MKAKTSRIITFVLIIALLVFRNYLDDIKAWSKTAYILAAACLFVVLFIVSKRVFATPNKPQEPKVKKTAKKKKGFIKEMLPDFSFVGDFGTADESQENDNGHTPAQKVTRERPSYEADESEE